MTAVFGLNFHWRYLQGLFTRSDTVAVTVPQFDRQNGWQTVTIDIMLNFNGDCDRDDVGPCKQTFDSPIRGTTALHFRWRQPWTSRPGWISLFCVFCRLSILLFYQNIIITGDLPGDGGRALPGGSFIFTRIYLYVWQVIYLETVDVHNLVVLLFLPVFTCMFDRWFTWRQWMSTTWWFWTGSG